MKVLITGADGQLGSDVVAELLRRNAEVIGTGLQEEHPLSIISVPYRKMDITDSDETERVILEQHPDAVIHCAAWTDVDGAEDREETVRRINAAGTGNVARAVKKIDGKMLYLSTDYVFDGQGSEPWKPDCRDYQPLNIYGQTKFEGEQEVSRILEKYFVVRISWVYGKNGKNFVRAMLNAAKKYEEVRVVNDQIGTPTYTVDLAVLLADMIVTDRYGYYHASNEGGFISWYDFACEIYRQAGCTTRVIPVSTAEYGLSKAKRPLNSRMDKTKLSEAGFRLLPDWQDALSRYLKEITSNGTDQS